MLVLRFRPTLRYQLHSETKKFVRPFHVRENDMDNNLFKSQSPNDQEIKKIKKLDNANFTQKRFGINLIDNPYSCLYSLSSSSLPYDTLTLDPLPCDSLPCDTLTLDP